MLDMDETRTNLSCLDHHLGCIQYLVTNYFVIVTHPSDLLLWLIILIMKIIMKIMKITGLDAREILFEATPFLGLSLRFAKNI